VAFKEAFAANLILNGDSWVAMIDDRNLTTHTYNETTALAVYQRIKCIYLELFVRLKERVAGELK
jgi:nucleotidyltransferase substrate binding protein (TIGR01987 family)